MAKTPAELRFTHEDYKSLPESETKHYELLEGELLLTPSPSWKHQQIAGNLAFQLKAFVQEHDLGQVAFAPLDVMLSEEDVVQPDILFISNERAAIVQEGVVQGAPDLIIEVLSPSTSERDLGYKRKLYARYGVKEYWVVDPEPETVEVLTLTPTGYRRAALYHKGQALRSPLLAGLEISLSAVFSRA